MHSLGIDVGGTFTDFVTLDEDGRITVHKQLTTPADPSVAVLDGCEQLANECIAAPADADRIIHGTTLVANSLIERRGARTALVTTAGFRDTLELGRESRYDLYDLELERPEPLVPRPLRLEVTERIRADGAVLDPLELPEAERVQLNSATSVSRASPSRLSTPIATRPTRSCSPMSSGAKRPLLT